MTYAVVAPTEFDSCYQGRGIGVRSPSLASRLGVVGAGMLMGLAVLVATPTAAPQHDEARAMPTVVAALRAEAPAPPYTPWFDPGFVGVAPTSLSQASPRAAAFEPIAPTPAIQIAEAEPVVSTPILVLSEPVETVPLPMPRPPELRAETREAPIRGPARPSVRRARSAVAPLVQADNRSFIEKLFGMGQPSSPGPALAYAAPDDLGFNVTRKERSIAVGPDDRRTAVYDIAARTVYMPDGSTLEAHSGLGEKLDDPRFVHERMRGPTPPHVYDLALREQLFHGVRALRLNPVGSGGIYGRNGLLAHTFMLGPNGDSNGCVSFRNYNAFLQAFLNGDVKRLSVVARRG